MIVVGTPREAKYAARLVVTVVFPDPPLELMTSVVFIPVAFGLLRGKRKGKIMPKSSDRLINYFTGMLEIPPVWRVAGL